MYPKTITWYNACSACCTFPPFYDTQARRRWLPDAVAVLPAEAQRLAALLTRGRVKSVRGRGLAGDTDCADPSRVLAWVRSPEMVGYEEIQPSLGT